MYPCLLLPFFALLLLSFPGRSQQSALPGAEQGDEDFILLSDILITSGDAEGEFVLPVNFSVVQNDQVHPMGHLTSLRESLQLASGVLVQGDQNFAQDVRISIRGNGSESAFGIRGISLLVDGFPLTSPDGQSQVDHVDPDMILTTQICKSNTSALLGNASGGFVRWTTLAFKAEPLTQVLLKGGSFGYYKLGMRVNRAREDVIFNSTLSVRNLKGYRNHSQSEGLIGSLGFLFTPTPLDAIKVVANGVWSPRARDPGGLSYRQASQGPREANADNIAFNAGERVGQGGLGVQYTRRLRRRGSIQLNHYSAYRRFENFLAFREGGATRLSRFSTNVTGKYSGEIDLDGCPSLTHRDCS